jgi:hypothetical protein
MRRTVATVESIQSRNRCSIAGRREQGYDAQRKRPSLTFRQYGTSYLHVTKAVKIEKSAAVASPDQELIEEEAFEDDNEALSRQSKPSLQLVNYDIIHSPSYQVPVLYITFDGRPHGAKSKAMPSPDEVYKILVPDTYRKGLRDLGVMGALSIADHPVPLRRCQTLSQIVGWLLASICCCGWA